MTRKQLEDLATLLDEQERRQKYCKFDTLFPDEGPYRRELYPKHIAFLDAGAKFYERAFVAANRSGKTNTATYEVAAHAMGRYPDWWKGRRFSKAPLIWVSSKTTEMTRNILQGYLCGRPGVEGTGYIPKELWVGNPITRPNTGGAYLELKVRHSSGGNSIIVFKAYDQKRAAFQGDAVDFILLDEEPNDPGIYSECLTRTMTTKGSIVMTFTPLNGLTPVVETFLPGGMFPENNVNGHKYVMNATWEDVPHLSQDEKDRLWASYADYEREARAKGIPSIGSGKVYKYMESEILVEPFKIPSYYKKAYGLDVGYSKTAAVWGAVDPDTNQVFLYSEYYKGDTSYILHAAAIKSRGEWMTGACDPSANRTYDQKDGTTLLQSYGEQGLNLIKADNSVHAGIQILGGMLGSGQLKVFNNLHNWVKEYRVYRRDEEGNIVKRDDHLMDATRYLMRHIFDISTQKEDDDEIDDRFWANRVNRNSVTGY